MHADGEGAQETWGSSAVLGNKAPPYLRKTKASKMRGKKGGTSTGGDLLSGNHKR